MQSNPDVDTLLGNIVDDSLSNALELRTQHEDPDPINLMRTAFPWPWADYQLDLLNKLLSRDYSRLVIMAPPRHRKPLSVDTLVLMADGSRKPLGDINPGDSIITHTGRQSTVLEVHEQGELQVLRIETQCGRSIFAAPDHPFLTPNGWTEAKNLRVGTPLAVARWPGVHASMTDQVTLIGDAGTAECRCLTVEHDDSFIANDLAVHNTTIIAGFMAIAVGEDPATRIMIASHTRDYSSLLMNQAEAIMRMPVYQRYYGDLLPKGKESRWSTHERHLPNRPVAIKDPTFLALSPDSGTPGFGADIIICFTPETLVTTPRGMVPISEISTGDTVLTHKGQFKRVKRTYRNWHSGTLVAMKVQGWPFTVRMTPNHPVYSAPRKICDRMFTPHPVKGFRYCRPDCAQERRGTGHCADWDQEPTFLPAELLRTSDFVVTPRIMGIEAGLDIPKGYGSSLRRPLKVDEPDFWWLVGLTLAEGSIIPHGVQNAIHIDESDLAENIKRFSKRVLGCKVSTVRLEEMHCQNLVIHSSKFRDFMRQFVLPLNDRDKRPAHRKFVPANVINWLDCDQALALLRGCFAGDGCQMTGVPGWRLISTSIHMLWSLRQVALRFGWPAAICNCSPACQKPGVLIGDIRTKTSHAKWELRLPGWVLNGGSPTWSKSAFTDDWVGFPIQKTEAEDYTGYVYNLEVEDDNSYVVGGFAVHNCDDVVSQANSSSATKRRHLEHWINASLLKRLEPDGKVIVIGARFYKEDYYGTLVDNPQVWESIILTATPEKPLWPWRWPSEALAQKQLEDPVFYPAQYMQDPLDIGSGVLDPSWFNFYLEVPPRSGMAIFAGIDPVIKTRGSKFSYVIVGRDQQGKVYLLDHYSARHSDLEQAGLIDQMWEQWQPVLVAFESNGPQESVMHFVQKDLKYPVNIIGVPSLTSKFLRLSSIAGHTRTGRVLLEGKWNDRGDELQPTPLSKPITKAWGKFPGGDTDLLDAFEKAVNIALQGPPPAFGSSSDAEHARKREENIKEARGAQHPGQHGRHPFTEPPQYGRVFQPHGGFMLGPND